MYVVYDVTAVNAYVKNTVAREGEITG